MTTDELKIEICDIECYKIMWCYCGLDPKTGKKYQFEISQRKNQIDALIKHLKEADREYIVAYNGVNYDSQIIQYILDSYDHWYNLSWKDVVQLISVFSSDCIERSNYELRPVYKEAYMDIRCIDPFRIHHYDNRNRQIGLKKLEFAMDLPNIQEIPIPWYQEELTDDEIQMVIDYCWNDVYALEKFWNITIGNTEHTLYKGKDMIQARLDVIDEMKFPWTAINWSNTKIGDEINKKGYMEETGCSYDDIYQKRKERKHTPQFTFGSCIPKYVKFKSKEFNDLYKKVKNIPVSMGKGEQEYVITYGETTYSIMRGGIHSHDGCRILETNEKYIIKDADIGSQYPNAINKRGLYPSHLGKAWNTRYCKTIETRIGYKSRGKKERKYAGLAETYKDCLNGGGYGKTNEASNWQYDPQVMYNCTIGNQFEILMLIEMLELEGISVVSANTDGIVCRIPRQLEDKYYEVCKEWEVIVGNDKMGQLEYADYSKLIQRDVNNYMAIKTDGEVKTKGVFEIDKLLHKNKSNRIRPICLVNWFKDGITPEETIAGNKDIYNYVIGKKASKDYSYKGIDRKTGETNSYDQIIRYVVTTKGEKMYKVKKEGSEKTGKAISKCEAKHDHQLLLNHMPDNIVWEELWLDTSYYSEEAWKIIEEIQPEMKRINKQKKTGQIDLFA